MNKLKIKLINLFKVIVGKYIKKFIIYYFYFFVKILANILSFLYKLYKIILWNNIVIFFKTLIKYLIIVPGKIVKFFYKKIKLHIFEDFIFLVVEFIWIDSGAKYHFYNNMRWYLYEGFWEGISDRAPKFFWALIKNYFVGLYWSYRGYKLEFKLFKRKTRKRLKFIYFKTINSNKILKYNIILILFCSALVLFVKFIYLLYINNICFIIIKRINFFLFSNGRYFILYLKFIRKFYFLRHTKVFNICKRAIILQMSYHKKLFYFEFFSWDFIKKNKNIFLFYKFKKDLKDFVFGKKRKTFIFNKRYNKWFLRALKKRKKFYKKIKRIIYIKNLWLYSMNYNIFYFYKTFFFIINFFYSNLIYLSDLYIYFLFWFCIV